MILQPLCVFYLLPIRDTFDKQLLSFTNIDQYYSQRARALARAFRVSRMHLQIIAVGVTNRRDQQKARFVAFVVCLGQT